MSSSRKILRISINLLVCLGVVPVIYYPTITLSIDQLTDNYNNSTVTDLSNFTNYSSSISGVKVKYPLNWQHAEQPVGRIYIIQFFSPLQNDADNFRDNINIAIENLPNNRTNVTQYSNASIRVITRSLPGFNLIASNNSENFHGSPAAEKIFTAKQAVLDKNLKAVALDLKMTQLYTLKNNKAYVITYAAETSNYDRYLPTVQKIIDSFQIMNLASNASRGISANVTS